MQWMRTSFLAFISCLILCGIPATLAQTCTDSAITNLRIITDQVVFGINNAGIDLPPITVKTQGSMGNWIDTGVETVTMQPPGNLTITGGSMTMTTSAGQATYTGYRISGSGLQRGTYYIGFNLCNGLRVDNLQVIIRANDAASIRYVTEPLPHMTSYGYIPIRPSLAYYDAAAAITDIPSLTTWELAVNDTSVSLSGHQVTPTITSGQIVAFPNFTIYVTNADVGKVFELTLKRVGSYVAANSTVPFPAVRYIRVVPCNADFSYTPVDPRASIEYFNILPNTGKISLRGWAFLPALNSTMSCKYNGLQYPMYVDDLCQVTCYIPKSLPPNRGYPFDFSFNGVNYSYIANVTILDPSRRRFYEPSAGTSNLYVFRNENVTVTGNFQVVDALGNFMYKFFESYDPLFPSNNMVTCNTTGYYAQLHRLSSTFYDPIGEEMVTPNNTMPIVNGAAQITFAFGNNLFGDTYPYCCHATGVESGCVNVNVLETCPSPPFVVNVTSDRCTQLANRNLVNCSTLGLTDVVVVGGNFGNVTSLIEIRVGPYLCESTVHDPVEPGRILYGKRCKGFGSDHTIYVLRPWEKIWGKWDKTFSYALVPVVESISGCKASYFPSTALCSTTGTDFVTIRGSNFGRFGAKVYFYYYIPPGDVTRLEPALSNITHFNDTHINVTGIIGQGSRFAVAVRALWEEETVNNYVTLSFTYTAMSSCPFAPSGAMCNAKGNCDFSTGFCSCFSDANRGFWTSLNCTTCQPNYATADCRTRCPTDAFNVICSNRGRCDDGVTGTGKCFCNAGYGGLACNISCPGGSANPCRGRGICIQNVEQPYCDCFGNTSTGFFAGTQCETCQTLYTGSTCKQLCPSNYLNPGVPCLGTGTCYSTATSAVCVCPSGSCGASCEFYGSDCGVCPSGRFGTNCTQFCPGFPNTCNNNGTCLEGPRGSGVCICSGGYSGAGCTVRCPGSNATSSCSGHGVCDADNGVCFCNAYWATADCSVSCPGLGSTEGICSGNGACNIQTGECSCIQGYTGDRCQTVCNGGIFSPCSFHGKCQSNGTCICDNNATVGYFTGASCALCQDSWFGPTCNQQCVKVNNVQCNGRGSCTASLQCKCYSDVILGFWAEPNCAQCKPNYYGPGCNIACPGGACNVCSGNGMCNDGVNGTGLCTCFANSTSGYWVGAKCSNCAPLYFGRTCTTKCPVSANNTECSGHGICSQGIIGTGLCACNASVATGFWGGTACDGCRPGYYGANCSQRCPGMATTGTACAGHGTCSDGFTGTGLCTCNAGYGLSDCSSGCPISQFQPCGGHGLCLDGASRNGTCQCFNNASYGFWTNGGCTACTAGYYGVSCILRCPRALGQICAGHGVCNDGTAGTGRCICDSGYSGVNCARPCDGGALSPCSGHGTCDQDTGRCTCFNTAQFGFWSGRNCTTCNPLFRSSDCTVACPVSSGNPTVACNAKGKCFEGICFDCTDQTCGDACDLSGTQCAQFCDAGKYGQDCQNTCPGSNANGSIVCSGRGVCSQGRQGTGQCRCFNGYWGTDCAGICPGGVATPCSNLGQCSSSGVCTCVVGYGLADCSGRCPGGPSNVCFGNGVCNLATVTCTCLPGYVGSDCSRECPGGAQNPCTGHGQCDAIAGACTCVNDTISGHWTNANCSACVSGYHGANCLQRCVNGQTVGTSCICSPFWSGANCDQPCPGSDAQTGAVCSGHGTCLWGNNYTTGICTCDEDYFTTTCGTFCTAAACAAAPYFLINGMCNATTGQCVCVNNELDGHWADTTTRCRTCQDFYWGPKCLNKCPCLERGTCDQTTGACKCFDSDLLGHYAGDNCQQCATGFIGSSCTNIDVSISRQRPCSTIIDITATSAFSLADTANGILLAGGRPIIICNLSSRLFVSSYDFNATVVSGMLIGDRYILTLGNIDGQPSNVRQQVAYAASRRPTFVPLQTGNYATVAASTSGAIMSEGSERRLMAHRAGLVEASLMGLSDPMAYISTTATSREVQFMEAAERSGRRMTVDTARRLAAASAFTSPLLMEQIAVDNSILLVFSNGVIQNLTDLTVVAQIDVTSFFDQLQGADITRTVLINPPLLVMGGYKAGSWVLASLPLPLVAGAVPTDFTSQVQSITSLCSSQGCTSTGKLVTDGTSVIVTVLTDKGAALLRYRYSQALPGVITSVDSALVMSDYTNVEVNVTAMYLDTVGGAGYVAMNLYSPSTGMQPSTIYRFSLVTLAVYGSVAFQKVVNSYEIVTSLTADAASRTLYATVPLQLQISIVPLNLYAVTKIFPTIADTYGGTVITVTGEGFADVAGLQCDFNNVRNLGEYVSSQEIHCTAPTGGDERCEGVPLEVSISESQFTNNGLRLRRVSSARVTSVYNEAYASDLVDNAYGPQTGGAVVVLIGFGFQQTIYLSCRFKADNQVAYGLYADEDYQRSSGAQGTRLDNVIFVNSTMVKCIQPAMPFPTSGTTSLELSLDGTVFSRSNNPYEVIGAPVGLMAFRKNAEGTWIYDFNDTYVSSERVDITAFTIFVVDSARQRVRKLDSVTRTINMTLGAFTFQTLLVGSSNTAFNFGSYCQYNETIRQYPIFYPSGQNWNTTTKGQTMLQGGYVLRPPAGTYYMLFQEATNGWKYNFTFTVTVGAAARLKICQEPSSSTNNLQPTLKRQPVLYAEDAAGNQLTSAALSTLRVSATYTVEHTVTTAVNAEDQLTKTVVGVPITVSYYNKTESRLAQLQGNFLQFDGIEITGLYGNTYSIIFSSPGLPNITSTPISIEWCNNNTERALTNPSVLMYFAKWGTSECFVCPHGALCDGTPEIRTYGDNYWRASSDSYVFYSCASPYSGDSCLAPNGTCKEGYRGPRCSSCQPGYGLTETYCKKCPSAGAMIGNTLLILIITFLFVAMSLLVSFTTYAVDALPAAIKLALNHFQVSSRIELTQTYADPLAKLFSVHFDISELVRFDAIPSECSPLNLDIYDRFFMTIFMPFIAILFFSLLLLGLYIYRRVKNIEIKNTPVLFSANSKNVRRERVMLVVARFMSRIRSAATKHRGDVRRDDERSQFFTVFEYLTSMSLVVLLMIYPSIITWCLVMWKCESITMGDGATLHTMEVLIADRTIDCNSDYHVTVKRWSLAAALFYGIIVPTAAFFTVRYWWQQFAGLHTRRLFTYYLCAYDSTMWWWETTVLLRKFVVVIVVMMVPDPILRTYLMMWVMAIALGLHGWFQPFDPLRPSFYYLEGLGITTMVLTLNLSLLFQFSAFEEGTPGYTALIVILLTMNIIVTAVFLLFLLRHVYFRAMRWWKGTEEEFDPEDPLSADRFIGDVEAGADGKRHSTVGRPDRRSVQADGVLGLLRKASTTGAAEQQADNKVVIDPTTVPVALGETPFERLKRLEAEKRKQFLRKDQAKTQASLEEELQELKERLARAEALAAAEEAVIRRNPHMAERRRQHEEELTRLMQLIRKERGEVKRLVDENQGLDNIQFEDQDEDDDDAFDIDDDY